MVQIVKDGVAHPPCKSSELVMDDKRKKLLLIKITDADTEIAKIFYSDEPFDLIDRTGDKLNYWYEKVRPNNDYPDYELTDSFTYHIAGIKDAYFIRSYDRRTLI